VANLELVKGDEVIVSRPIRTHAVSENAGVGKSLNVITIPLKILVQPSVTPSAFAGDLILPAGSVVHPAPPSGSSSVEPTTIDTPSKRGEQIPSSMAQLFRDYDSLAKSRPTEAASPANMPPVKPAPATCLPGESGLHAASPWDPASAKVTPPLKQGPLGAPPASPRPISPELQSAARDSTRPGEFTSFFQGPFQGDKAAEMPAFSSQPIEPPKKTVGEFTALFGQSNSSVAATPAPASPSEPSFTSIFKDMASPQPMFNAPAPVQGGVIPPPAQPLPAVHSVNGAPLPDPVFVAPTPALTPTPTPPLSPTPQLPSTPVERPGSERQTSLPGDGATGAFLRPAAEPAQVPVAAPAGPIPYTQILKHTESKEEATGPSATAGGGQIVTPSAPKIPAAARPPKTEAARASEITKVDAPTQSSVSIWPLIITLTVLFLLALSIVVFFVMKH
jgi:hypothetical protein